MFVLDAKADEEAAPDEVPRLIAIDGEQQEVNGSHPEERLEGVHRVATSDGDDDGSKEDRKAGEEDGKALAAKFAGNQSGKNDFESVSYSREKTKGVQRLAQEYSIYAQHQR